MPYDGDTFLAGLAVYVVLKNDKDEVFLLRRINSAWKNGYYSLPAGRVEEGETFIEGAIREAHEEAGVTVAADDLSLYAVINRRDTGQYADWIDLFYNAEKWQGEASAFETDKFDHGAWFPLNALPENIIENQRDGLSELGAKTIAHKFIDYLSRDRNAA